MAKTLNLALTVTAGSTVTIGETTQLTAGDDGNGNLLIVQLATLSQQATLESLSFYVTAAAGVLVLGVYNSTVAGVPGTLIAQTAEFTPVKGWNTKPTTTNPLLAPGEYWLCYFPSSSLLNFVKLDGVITTAFLKKTTFAATLPAIYPSGSSAVATVWSLYATLSGAPVTPAVISVGLTPTSLIIPSSGNDAGDVIGAVTIVTTPGYTPSAVTLSGPDAAKFALTNGGVAPCNLIVGPNNVPAGSYSISLTAS
jgi:hypothetical protein